MPYDFSRCRNFFPLRRKGFDFDDKSSFFPRRRTLWLCHTNYLSSRPLNLHRLGRVHADLRVQNCVKQLRCIRQQRSIRRSVSPAALQSRWSSCWCCRVWITATPRLPVYPPTNSTDYSQFSMLPHVSCFRHGNTSISHRYFGTCIGFWYLSA